MKKIKAFVQAQIAKVKAFYASKVGKMASMVSVATAVLPVAAHAEELPTTVDMSQITTALTTAITPGMVLSVIAIAIGSGLTFVLVWFGSRKITQVFITALKKGKIHF